MSDRPLPVFVQGGRRGTEGQQGRNGFQAGPAAPLLLAADEERIEAAAPPHDHRPGPRHAPELVRAHAHQVGLERGQVHRHVSARRGGIDVHRDVHLLAQGHDVLDRLEASDFVVGPLAVHERRSGSGWVPEPGP